MRYKALARVESLQALDFNRFADVHAIESLRLAVRRELRVHRGQRALARLIGVCRGTLRKFVEMRSLPTYRNLRRSVTGQPTAPRVVPRSGPSRSRF